MTDSFLYLDIDSKGIQAFMLELSFSKKKVWDQYTLKYDDLPETDTKDSLFHRGMAAISENLDLDQCSEAVLFIDSGQISFRNPSLPFFRKKKIKQVLPFELADLMPLPDNPYVTDFLIQTVCFRENQQLVLSASIPKPIIEDYVDCLKSYKISPLVITPKGYAGAVNFVNKVQESSDHLFIYLGNNDNAIILVVDNLPVIVRSLGPLSDSDPVLDIVRAVHQTLTGFARQSGSVEVLDLCIGLSNRAQISNKTMGQLKKTLADHPGLNPSIIKTIDPEEVILDMSPLRPPGQLLNFCIGEFASDTLVRRYKSSLVTTLVLLLFIAGLFYYNIQKDIKGLEEQILSEKKYTVALYNKTFPGRKSRQIQAPVPMMEARLKQAKKKNKTGSSKKKMDPGADVKAVDLLLELSRKIPNAIDVELDRFLLNQSRLVISGSTDNFKNVDRLKGVISSSDLFHKVSISSAKADKAGNRVFFKFIIGV